MPNDKATRTTIHLSVTHEDNDRLDMLAERLDVGKAKTASIAFKLLEQYLSAGVNPTEVVLTLLPLGNAPKG